MFGCIAFALTPSKSLHKLDERTQKCIILGYCLDSKAYKLYNPFVHKVIAMKKLIGTGRRKRHQLQPFQLKKQLFVKMQMNMGTSNCSLVILMQVKMHNTKSRPQMALHLDEPEVWQSYMRTAPSLLALWIQAPMKKLWKIQSRKLLWKRSLIAYTGIVLGNSQSYHRGES